MAAQTKSKPAAEPEVKAAGGEPGVGFIVIEPHPGERRAIRALQLIFWALMVIACSILVVKCGLGSVGGA
jgi:hypothetical protein